jgi:hypothetical protein
MIKEMINQQNIDCIGGFTAAFADPIMAHIDPGQLYKNDIAVIINHDKTIWATKIAQQDNIEWVEISRDNINKKTSPIAKKNHFFEIKNGELYGTYLISEDFISNEHFNGNKSYLDFLLGA